jgi:hypothetical protein
MEPQYFLNKDLQFLKMISVMFAALPLCMLLYLYMTPDIDNQAEMVKVFSCISLVMVLFSALAWKILDALPAHYLSLYQGKIDIPQAGFLNWKKGAYVTVDHSDIQDVIYDNRSSSANLVVVFPAREDIQAGNMVLGHMRFEKTSGQTQLVLCGIKKKDGLKWQKRLSNTPVHS